MSKSLMKSAIDALMPKGSIWTPKPGGFFEALLTGIADSFEIIRSKLSELSDIRNAKKTTLLDELERDHGLAFNSNLTEAERRSALFSRINAIDNTGSRQELEQAIQLAGFPLFVYSNSPAVDPIKLLINYEFTAGDDNAFAGDAFASGSGANLVVNGDVKLNPPVPTDPNAWPFIFFVGGDATFDIDGSLISIDFVNISEDRRQELREIVLRYKPAFTWGGLIVNFT